MITNMILSLLIIFIAGTVQGLTSFGFSLISLPLLCMIIPLKTVVPILIIYSLIINSIIFYKIRYYVNLNRIKYLIIAGVVSTPIGTYVLLVIKGDVLSIVVGSIIIFTSLILWKGYKVNIKNEKLSFIIVGLFSGILNGSVSLSGPPIILFLTNQNAEKQIFRANLTSYFLILNIITVPTYLFAGLITKEVLRYSAFLFPGLIIGVLSGLAISNKINDNIFKKIILILVCIMGVLSVVSNLS